MLFWAFSFSAILVHLKFFHQLRIKKNSMRLSLDENQHDCKRFRGSRDWFWTLFSEFLYTYFTSITMLGKSWFLESRINYEKELIKIRKTIIIAIVMVGRSQIFRLWFLKSVISRFYQLLCFLWKSMIDIWIFCTFEKSISENKKFIITKKVNFQNRFFIWLYNSKCHYKRFSHNQKIAQRHIGLEQLLHGRI